MKTLRLVAFSVLTLASLPGLASGADYYVSTVGSDTAVGSSSAPWRTIAKGVGTVRPGDTLHVRPGTYPESPVSNTDGTSSARIRYVSDTKWGAKIKHWENNADYTDIVGFEIDFGTNVTPTGTNGNSGILDEGNHNRLLNNHIFNVTGSGINTTGWTSAAPYGGVDTEIIGNVIHHTGSANLTHGIYFAHKQGVVKNNIVYDVRDCGIHLWHNPSDIVITNNLVFNIGGCGIVVGAGDFTGALVQNVLVANNIFMDANSGITENGDTGANNRYINNIVWNMRVRNTGLQNGTITGTIIADPRLVNYKTDGTGDYHLTSASPAINAGIAEGAPITDLDGVQRPQDTKYDIGPYEFTGTVTPLPPPPRPDITSGLMGYWKLDEATGVPLIRQDWQHGYVQRSSTRVAGKIGGAFHFDGGSQRVTFANTSALNLHGGQVQLDDGGLGTPHRRRGHSLAGHLHLRQLDGLDGPQRGHQRH